MNYTKVEANYVTSMCTRDGITTQVLFNVCNIVSVQPTRNNTPKCIVSCTDGEHYLLEESYEDFIGRTFRKDY